MKTFLLAGAVVLGLLQSARAYSLAGPVGNGGDAWQVPAIGYGLGGDLNAPKNIGEEFRRNVPTYYYAFDANFLGFFGSNGVVAVSSAFTLLNNLTNVDSYSKSLSEFPLESRHINYQAQALGLMDLKSATFGLMVEQLGLADPIRYSWTLHDRYLPAGGKCPDDVEYLVVQRNFDIVSSPLNQLQYSPYVNDILYSYQIIESCPPSIPTAIAEPYSADPLADTYSPVASFASGTLSMGGYYTGLTRDDVAGLRYLLQASNINTESPAPDSLLYTITTNFDGNAEEPFPPVGITGTNGISTNGVGYYYYTGTTNGGLGYGNLAPFLSFAKTNSPAALQAAYPGVAIASYTTTWTWSSNATYSSYYAPPPAGWPYGSPPRLVVVTNYTGYWQPIYNYSFANVFTNHYSTNGIALKQTISATAPPGTPYGSALLTTNTVKIKNQVSGDFFVLPLFYTNVCPLDIIDGSHYNVVATTNLLTTASTNVLSTNYTGSVYYITYFTNYSYLIAPVTCTAGATNSTGLYEGIENIKFVPSSYDSLLGQFFQPITNNYSMVMINNSQAVTQHFQRIVTTPDFLFSAVDQASGPASLPGVAFGSRNLNFDTANVLSGLAGPGTITTPTTITYDKVGPVYFNDGSDVLDGTPYFTQTPGGDLTNFFYEAYFVWGSFDGTTNAPVVYPNGTSIDDLGNMIQIQISPTSVPSGDVGYTYPLSANSIQFTVTGGSFSQPYTWSAAGLPAGLSISPDGALTGVPTQAGNYVFILTMTDSLGRSVQWAYPITIQ